MRSSFAAGDPPPRRDAAHGDALPVIVGIDGGSLPEGAVLDCVLAETLNGLTTHAGHEAAVDFLDRTEENARFHVEGLGHLYAFDDGFDRVDGVYRLDTASNPHEPE